MSIPASGGASVDVQCPFCEIGAGVMDQDLIAVQTDNVVVVPTLKQRPANPGQVVVIPRSHVIGLAGASSALLGELFAVVARVTAAAPNAFGAVGTTTFNNNDAPDRRGGRHGVITLGTSAAYFRTRKRSIVTGPDCVLLNGSRSILPRPGVEKRTPSPSSTGSTYTRTSSTSPRCRH